MRVPVIMLVNNRLSFCGASFRYLHIEQRSPARLLSRTLRLGFGCFPFSIFAIARIYKSAPSVSQLWEPFLPAPSCYFPDYPYDTGLFRIGVNLFGN